MPASQPGLLEQGSVISRKGQETARAGLRACAAFLLQHGKPVAD